MEKQFSSQSHEDRYRLLAGFGIDAGPLAFDLWHLPILGLSRPVIEDNEGRQWITPMYDAITGIGWTQESLSQFHVNQYEQRSLAFVEDSEPVMIKSNDYVWLANETMISSLERLSQFNMKFSNYAKQLKSWPIFLNTDMHYSFGTITEFEGMSKIIKALGYKIFIELFEGTLVKRTLLDGYDCLESGFIETATQVIVSSARDISNPKIQATMVAGTVLFGGYGDFEILTGRHSNQRDNQYRSMVYEVVQLFKDYRLDFDVYIDIDGDVERVQIIPKII